jgi:hypothetical protein
MALGANAKLFCGHSNDAILKKSYLSSAYMAGGLILRCFSHFIRATIKPN